MSHVAQEEQRRPSPAQCPFIDQVQEMVERSCSPHDGNVGLVHALAGIGYRSGKGTLHGRKTEGDEIFGAKAR